MGVGLTLGNMVPSGIIALWYGNQSGTDIPSGWVICDGNNGTPDLTDKFIMCFGANSIGTTGGTIDHQHSVALNSGSQIIDSTPAGSWDSVGLTNMADNIPPFYCLAYIMKL